MATTIELISQTISTIPALRHRSTVNPTSQADKDNFVIKYEANNDHLATITTLEINTLKTELNTSIGQINTVADEVATKASEASTSASEASTSASTATIKASEASTSAGEASASRNQAEAFAQQAQSSASSVDDMAYTVETIEDIMAVSAEFNTVIVKDVNRGGIFVSKTEVAIDPNTGSVYTVNGGTVFAKTGGGFWVRQYSGSKTRKMFGYINDNYSMGGDIINEKDFATILDSITPSSNMVGYTLTNFTLDSNDFATLATSIVGSKVTYPLPTLKRYSMYVIEVDISTVTSGRLAIQLGGVSPYIDNAQGYYFSTIVPLLDPYEGGIVLDNKTFRFAMMIQSLNAGTENITISVIEPNWTGTIEAIRVSEVEEVPFFSAAISEGSGDDTIISTDIVTPSKYNPIGLKRGRNWFGAVVLGDRQTAPILQHTGTYSDGNGGHNIAIGLRALASCTLGMQNTAIGVDSMSFTEGSHNTALGYGSLKYNTKGQHNTAVGYKSYTSNTVGYNNIGLGFWAGALNQDGIDNVSIGVYTGNSEHGNYNTSIGNRSGAVSKDGSNNTYLGYRAGYSPNLLLGNTKWNQQTAVGSLSQVSGEGTIAIGYDSIAGIRDDFTLNKAYAIAIGHKANASETNAIAIGKDSLASKTHSITIGSTSIASGDYSVAFGRNTKASGLNTTALGYASGTANIVGANCTFLGFLSGSTTNAGWTNVTTLGNNAQVTGSNQVQLGDSATTTYVYGTVQNRSDIRDKDDVQDSDLGLDFISKLRPVKYKWDLRDSYYDYKEDDEGNIVRIELPKDGSKKRNRYHYGLIAQELKDVSDTIGIDFGGLQDHSINGGSDVMSIGYDELIAPLIKAVQELKAEVDVLKNTIKTYDELLELQSDDDEY